MELVIFDILIRIGGLWLFSGYLAAIFMTIVELVYRSNIWTVDYFYHTFIKYPLVAGPLFLFRVLQALCGANWRKGE